jgi:hypothetical protein
LLYVDNLGWQYTCLITLRCSLLGRYTCNFSTTNIRTVNTCFAMLQIGLVHILLCNNVTQNADLVPIIY